MADPEMNIRKVRLSDPESNMSKWGYSLSPKGIIVTAFSHNEFYEPVENRMMNKIVSAAPPELTRGIANSHLLFLVRLILMYASTSQNELKNVIAEIGRAYNASLWPIISVPDMWNWVIEMNLINPRDPAATLNLLRNPEMTRFQISDDGSGAITGSIPAEFSAQGEIAARAMRWLKDRVRNPVWSFACDGRQFEFKVKVPISYRGRPPGTTAGDPRAITIDLDAAFQIGPNDNFANVLADKMALFVVSVSNTAGDVLANNEIRANMKKIEAKLAALAIAGTAEFTMTRSNGAMAVKTKATIEDQVFERAVNPDSDAEVSGWVDMIDGWRRDTMKAKILALRGAPSPAAPAPARSPADS